MPVNRLKTTYQRNFMLGTLTAAIVALAVCGWLYLDREPNRKITLDLNRIVYTDINIRKAGDGPRKGEDIIEPGGVRHGFRIPEKDIGSLFDSSGSAKSGPLADKMQSLTGSKIVPIADPNHRPSGGNRIAPLTDYSGLSPNRHRNGRRSSAAEPGISNRPLWINNLDVRHPFNPAGLVDTVVLLMTINTSGAITNIETIYTGYPDMGFVFQFKKALYDAEIFPAVQDGRPIEGTYPIWCIFADTASAELVKNSESIQIGPRNQ